MNTDPCIFVIVPLFDRFDNIPRLFDQLSAQTYRNHRLILVDHGTKTLPSEMRIPRIIYLVGSSSNWWSGAVNIGLRYVLETLKVPETDYVLLQNDDVRFGPELLEGLLIAQRKNARSVVGAITLQYGTKQILDAHNSLNYWQGKHVSPLKGKMLNAAVNRTLRSDVLKGRGVLYPVHAVRAIGYTDERLHYRADTEWSFRARRAGYELFVTPNVVVETVQDSQEGARRRKGIKYFNDYVFSKRSTQNLYAAWVYFKDCFGPVACLWPFMVHALRTVIFGLFFAIKG